MNIYYLFCFDIFLVSILYLVYLRFKRFISEVYERHK